MTKLRAEAATWAGALADAAGGTGWPGVQPFVVPPATAIAEVAGALAGTRVLVGAQDAHWEDAGAWTGELSVPQVADAGAQLVEIGHSERREHFGETDATVSLKVRAVLRHGLVPLVCVGESAEVFTAGGSVTHVLAQVRAALAGVEELAQVVVAYEPVWAIGEHGREASPDDVVDVFAALAEECSEVAAVLYGGSVTAHNAAATLAVPGVDGLFVGRAAWQVEGFLGLLDLAAALPRTTVR